MNKKIIAFILAGLMVVSVCACSQVDAIDVDTGATLAGSITATDTTTNWKSTLDTIEVTEVDGYITALRFYPEWFAEAFTGAITEVNTNFTFDICCYNSDGDYWNSGNSYNFTITEKGIVPMSKNAVVKTDGSYYFKLGEPIAVDEVSKVAITGLFKTSKDGNGIWKVELCVEKI